MINTALLQPANFITIAIISLISIHLASMIADKLGDSE